jgi:hypothetical protein
MSRKVLLIDFDGTLAKYNGWLGPDVLGEPLEKARHAMILLDGTYRLVCFTARPTAMVENWLRHWGFPKMRVTNIKEPAFLIVDDRSLLFTGEWTDEFIQKIKDFKPHWAKDQDEPT